MKLIALAVALLAPIAIAQAPRMGPNGPIGGATPAAPASVELTPSKPVDKDLQIAILFQQVVSQQIQLLQDAAEKEVAKRSVSLNYQGTKLEEQIRAGIDAMKKANGWGDDVTCDRATLKCSRAVQAAPPAPTAK